MTEQEKLEMNRGTMDSRPFSQKNEQEQREIIRDAVEKYSLSQKAVLTSKEAALYLGISLSKLYKLTCAKEIPHYKPNGKLNYFERQEIETWALRNRIATNAEISNLALSKGRREPWK